MSRRLFPYLLAAPCLAALLASCSFRDDARSGDILFVREKGIGNSAIYLMSDDGGDIRRLVAGDSPRWSPDGTRFAYVAENAYGDLSVWVMNPETREKRRVVEEGVWCCVSWAPDGVRLAYSGGRRILIVNTETRDSELVSIGFSVDGPSDWSPDGRKLLVSSGSVKVLDLRTGAEREIAPRRAVSGARWSPDGERMVFAEQSARYNPRRKAFDVPKGPAESTIVVAARDGGGREPVTRGAFDHEPAWSDDGGRIYFTRQPAVGFLAKAPASDLYVVDLETRSMQRLTETAVTGRSPDARPPHRSLPDVPAPATGGNVVVPDLVDELLSLEDERHRFRGLDLKLRSAFPPLPGWLFVVTEQVPVGGSRVPTGTVVKLDGYDLAGVYEAFRESFWRGSGRRRSVARRAVREGPCTRTSWTASCDGARRGSASSRCSASPAGRTAVRLPGRSSGWSAAASTFESSSTVAAAWRASTSRRADGGVAPVDDPWVIPPAPVCNKPVPIPSNRRS